jgi:hypothetical protein
MARKRSLGADRKPSSELIGIASARLPFVVSRAWERPTVMSPDVKSTSAFWSPNSSPFRMPV